MKRHYLLAAGLAVAVTGVSAPAWAAWQSNGTGTATATAARVQAPASASAAPTTGATSTSLTVSWTAPASGPAPTGYRVDRVSPAGTVCTVGAAKLSCSDGSLTGGTAYTYRVYALVNLWNGTAQSAAGTTATAAPLVIDSVARAAGNKKVAFSGSGAAAGAVLTVTICAVNSFPCASPSATSTVTPTAAGAWTSAQSNNNLAASQTYYAQAVQGSSVSAVLTFSTTNL